MPIYHLLYRTQTASTVPSAVDMPAGRLALNTTDERIFFRNTGGSIVEPQPRAHTHTISQITDLNKGLANGVASLDANAQVPLSQIPPAPINTVAGTSVTIGTTVGTNVVSGYYTRFTSASAVTVTVNTGVATVGQEFHIRQAGAGLVTLVAGSGVTINVPFQGTLALAGQGATVTLKCVASNTYDLFGLVNAA